jgi:putative hemolysin
LSSNLVPWPPLVGVIASLLIGALFAGADTALTSLSATRLEALIDQATGPDKAAYQRIQQQDAKLRSRYLLGRVASPAVTAVCMLELCEPLFPSFAGWVALGATILATAVLFEISTTLARKRADHAAAWAARWMRPLEITLLPLAIPLGWLGARIRERGGEQPVDPGVTEAEVEALVDEGERAGIFAGAPAEMIRNVLDFAERTAKDAMIPRNKVEAIEVTTSLDDARRLVAESGHSRYPIYRERLDNVVGLLHAKDLYRAGQPGDGPAVRKLEELLRTPANFVAESQPLATLLREMRARRQHLAVVVDEFGSLSGIVTLEDVLEEIVGEIHDEHDTEGTIEDLGEGRVMADAAISMKDLCTHLGADVPKGVDESLGGMMTAHLGKVPSAGTAFSKFGLRFIVRTMDDEQVGKVEVIRA